MANDDERRPYPPVNFIDSENWQPYTRLIPTNEVHEWIDCQIISSTGSIHNPDHEQLLFVGVWLDREEEALRSRPGRTGNAPRRWMAEGLNGTADVSMVRADTEVHQHAGSGLLLTMQ